jgi:hypothetical protein
MREQVYQSFLVLFALELILGYASLYRNGEGAAESLASRQNDSINSNNNKTLVILIGSLRGGELAWSTLAEHVLDVNHADLALLLGTATPIMYRDASLFQRAKYHWKVPEYDDWADAIDLINGTIWRERVFPILYEFGYVLGGIKVHGNQYGSGAVIFMLRWFLSNHLQDEQEETAGTGGGAPDAGGWKSLLQKYERFIITRTDHYYLCRHDISQLDPNVLWVPDGEDYGGITDRHLVVSRDQVLQALDILPPVLQDPTQYAHLLDNRYGNTVETLIDFRWKQESLPVRRFSRMMFTCGQDGDTTRFRNMGVEVREGVRLKYGKEYVSSYATCGLQIGI